jgi:hypothetical protein
VNAGKAAGDCAAEIIVRAVADEEEVGRRHRRD